MCFLQSFMVKCFMYNMENLVQSLLLGQYFDITFSLGKPSKSTVIS